MSFSNTVQLESYKGSSDKFFLDGVTMEVYARKLAELFAKEKGKRRAAERVRDSKSQMR